MTNEKVIVPPRTGKINMYGFKTNIDFSRFINACSSKDIDKINKAREIAIGEMKEVEKRLRTIQSTNKDFDAGREWSDGKHHEYFPHATSTKDHHNTWCDCALCKDDSEIYFDYCRVIVILSDKVREILIENPENLVFSNRGVGLDHVKCVICGKDGLNNNIAAFVRNKEEGEKIIGWFSKHHVQFLAYIFIQVTIIMTTKGEQRNRDACEVALNGKYDADWNLCQLPKSQLSKIIAIDGFGLVRDQTRHSDVLDKIVTVKDIVGVAGKKRAIVRGKGFGYESLYEVPIGDNIYEDWLDTYKVKPELEGKKSKIKMTNMDFDDETRFFVAVNEPALNRWKKKFET